MPGGGHPDKIGNRYEQRWVLHQLIALVSSKHDIQSLEWEPAGDDGRGVDLWVNYNNGQRYAYQCKVKNGSKGVWSLADLARRGILRDLRFQVERDPNRHKFILVSGAPSPDLVDLCKEAEDSRDSETFLKAQIQPVGRLRHLLASFCTASGLAGTEEQNAHRAWELLRGSGFHLFHYHDQQRMDMAERLAPWVTSEPLSALSVLETMLTKNLRRQIDIEAIEKCLEICGVRLLRGSTDRWDQARKEVLQKRREEGQLLKLNAELAKASLEVRRELQGCVAAQHLTERWSLVRPLGEGRFGRVWLAHDSLTKQVVAAKVLHAELAEDSAACEKFYRGGLAVSKLNITAAGVIRVLEPPQCWEGIHFYIMEHFGAWPLSELVSQPPPGHPLGVTERTGFGESDAVLRSEFVWKVVHTTGEALGALHRNGLIHCDVAPWNILVASNGEVKLSDFDLLRMKGEIRDSERSTFCSVPYTAPEVLDLRGAMMAETDIYSLALVIIY